MKASEESVESGIRAIVPPKSGAGDRDRNLIGSRLQIEFVRIAPGETTRRMHGPECGEEIGVVVSGVLQVASGEETYTLSAGEGIIIPPGEGSSWTAEGASGLLYRVVVRPEVT